MMVWIVFCYKCREFRVYVIWKAIVYKFEIEEKFMSFSSFFEGYKTRFDIYKLVTCSANGADNSP